nr:recombinase family protein [Mycobacterium intermedium]
MVHCRANSVGWSHSAIRAILDNPTYRGVRVWGKQEKYEVLALSANLS